MDVMGLIFGTVSVSCKERIDLWDGEIRVKVTIALIIAILLHRNEAQSRGLFDSKLHFFSINLCCTKRLTYVVGGRVEKLGYQAKCWLGMILA